MKVSEVYKRLYHYTDWNGLQGILHAQSLWATNYKFLNDYTELVLFRDKLTSLITKDVHREYQKIVDDGLVSSEVLEGIGGLDGAVRHDSDVFVDAQYNAMGDRKKNRGQIPVFSNIRIN